MTEKRFTLIKNTGTDECYCDNLYDNGTYIGAINGGSKMICYLLNSLSEENEQLKQQLKSIDDNFELNWNQNYVEFDKDKLEIKDVHTKIYLNGAGLLIEVYIPQIDEYYRFKYYVTGRNLMDRFIREYHSKGDVE